MVDEKEKLVLESPDNVSIPCRTCVWGQHYYLALYCAKYREKPLNVYYKNAQCPNYKAK